jgi:hypothetical protein
MSCVEYLQWAVLVHGHASMLLRCTDGATKLKDWKFVYGKDLLAMLDKGEAELRVARAANPEHDINANLDISPTPTKESKRAP